jgi:hypothetical protein
MFLSNSSQLGDQGEPMASRFDYCLCSASRSNMPLDSSVIKIRQHDPTGVIPDEPEAALFQQQWQLYRKFIQSFVSSRGLRRVAPDFG